MPTFRTHRLGEMGWREARDAAAHNPVVLLPVGAVEQHGPHLPLQEDSIVAEFVAEHTAWETAALVTPTVMYGHSPAFEGFAGTLNLRLDTLTAVLTDICDGLIGHGFRRIIVVNNNGGNEAAVAAAASEMRTRHGVIVGTVYPWKLGYELMRDQYSDCNRVYGHGAEPEHSAMLAMFPEQVRSTAVEPSGFVDFDGWQPSGYTSARIPGQQIDGTIFWNFTDVCPSGVSGDPDAADVSVGRLWVERVLGFCIDYVKEYDKNTQNASWTQSRTLA